MSNGTQPWLSRTSRGSRFGLGRFGTETEETCSPDAGLSRRVGCGNASLDATPNVVIAV